VVRKRIMITAFLMIGFFMLIATGLSSPAFQAQSVKKEKKPAPPPQTSTKGKGIEKVKEALAAREKEREKRLRYNIGLARDPFRNPVAPTAGKGRGRPPGEKGMLISELQLVGIVKKGNEYIAFFNGSDNVGYFLRVNDRVYDGWVKKIGPDYVIFEQEINDPYSLKKTREVVKKLYSEGGGK